MEEDEKTLGEKTRDEISRMQQEAKNEIKERIKEEIEEEVKAKIKEEIQKRMVQEAAKQTATNVANTAASTTATAGGAAAGGAAGGASAGGGAVAIFNPISLIVIAIIIVVFIIIVCILAAMGWGAGHYEVEENSKGMMKVEAAEYEDSSEETGEVTEEEASESTSSESTSSESTSSESTSSGSTSSGSTSSGSTSNPGTAGTVTIEGTEVETFTNSRGITYTLFKQNKGPWSTVEYAEGHTIAEWGCPAVTYATVGKALGVECTPRDFAPLNDTLLTKNGIILNRINVSNYKIQTDESHKNAIIGYLQEGHPVIFNVHGPKYSENGDTSKRGETIFTKNTQHWMVLIDINQDASQVYVAVGNDNEPSGWYDIDVALNSLYFYYDVYK